MSGDPNRNNDDGDDGDDDKSPRPLPFQRLLGRMSQLPMTGILIILLTGVQAYAWWALYWYRVSFPDLAFPQVPLVASAAVSGVVCLMGARLILVGHLIERDFITLVQRPRPPAAKVEKTE